MTEPGETDEFSLDDHVRVLREHTGCDLFDYVLINDTAPTAAQLAAYRSDGADLIPVDDDLPSAGGATCVLADLLDTSADYVRHDGDKLASAILEIAARRRPSFATARSSRFELPAPLFRHEN